MGTFGGIMSSFLQDHIWIHFGEARHRWLERCVRCQEHSENVRGEVPEEALSCWKVEVWYSCWTCPQAIDAALLNWAMEEPGLAGKMSLEPIEVIASDPAQAPYPTTKCRVALIYVGLEQEIKVVKEETVHRLASSGAGRGRVHHRRGCWSYDEIYSPWPTWSSLSTC